MDRRVTASGKDKDGDITALCNSGEIWSPRQISSAINDIEGGSYRYYVRDTQGNEVDVKVGSRNGSKYLYTEADQSSANNLDNLPNC